MALYALLQYGVFLLIVTALVYPFGSYLTRVFAGESTWLDPGLRPLERVFYRLAGIDVHHEMDWKEYASAFLVFSATGTLLLYAILRVQPFLHTFDPVYQPTPLSPDLALNTAISFATTTTWQAYGGETAMSYLSQIVGLAVQNFLAGAAGLAVGIAFIRGLVRERTTGLGNFWVDLTRATLWVLLPLSLVGGLLLVWQGVPANLKPYQVVPLLQPTRYQQPSMSSNGNPVTDPSGQPIMETVQVTQQVIPQGPVAALEFIKNLGTNGGGFFNANGAHPYENPTPLTNLLEMLAIAVLPAALTHTFGRMSGRPRDGWLLFGIMVVLFTAGLALCGWAEQTGNPRLGQAGTVDQRVTTGQPGGNMEGKETRFGISGSVLTAITTSNGATGSYNAMHDSFTPLGGMIPLGNMLLGEVIFGGLGTGLVSMILVALIGVFVGGMMVGRPPEYLGKPIGPPEMKLISLYALLGPVTILLLTALAAVTAPGLAGLTINSGPHGLSEIVYAYASSMANNGQNFGGLNTNTPFYNLTTAGAMMVGRFGLTMLALALAGHLAPRPRRPVSPGTLPTDTPLFAGWLIGIIVIIGGLSYLPVLALGPVVEHLLLGI
jgi:K+-transporting ATPase ATPase A chain